MNYVYVGGVLACKCWSRGLNPLKEELQSYEPSNMAAGNTDPLWKQQTVLATEPFHQLQ